MRVLEIVQMLAALLLAGLVALMSQGAEARQEVSNFLVEILNPAIPDLAMDPSCFLEGASETIWLLPEPDPSAAVSEHTPNLADCAGADYSICLA